MMRCETWRWLESKYVTESAQEKEVELKRVRPQGEAGAVRLSRSYRM
jgi:hypothetical protein